MKTIKTRIFKVLRVKAIIEKLNFICSIFMLENSNSSLETFKHFEKYNKSCRAGRTTM